MSTAPLIGISRHRLVTDGDGITSLVAFHECTLRCAYCLNRQCLRKDGVWNTLTPEEVFEEVRKDELYFLATGGGVCFGGGEPTLRVEFIEEFCKLCDEEWLITIETALNVPSENIRRLLPLADHWIVDIKDMNPEIYKSYTQRSNERVISNLKILAEAGAEVTIRVPLIPKYNSESDVEASIEKLKTLGFSNFDKFSYITEINK